jgi:hypothetical protein
MLARILLVWFFLLPCGRANAGGTKSPPTASQVCHQNIALGRSIWSQELFVAPPDVSALMVDVIDGKVPQALQKLNDLPPGESARWRQTALLTAAFAGQAAMTEALLNQGADVDGRGWMPAYKPAFFDASVNAMKQDPRFGGSKAVDGMKTSGLMNNQGQDMGTALAAAVGCDDAATVDVLLRHHADAGTRLRPDGADVLILAIIHGNATIARALLDHGVAPCDDDRRERHIRTAYNTAHPGHEDTGPLLTYAAMGRRAKLPDDLIARLTCPAYDTASLAGH